MKYIIVHLYGCESYNLQMHTKRIKVKDGNSAQYQLKLKDEWLLSIIELESFFYTKSI